MPRTRLGTQIRAPQLRVIDDAGAQLGVLSNADAQALATEQNLDLVEVSPQAEPPVARVMDYGKYKYEQEKLHQKQRKPKGGQVKEIRLSMKIGAHDLDYRMKRAREFLAEGHKVKLNVMMKGRENAYPKIAMERVKQYATLLEDTKIEQEPTRAGRSISLVVTPEKKTSKGSNVKREATP